MLLWKKAPALTQIRTRKRKGLSVMAIAPQIDIWESVVPNRVTRTRTTLNLGGLIELQDSHRVGCWDFYHHISRTNKARLRSQEPLCYVPFLTAWCPHFLFTELRKSCTSGRDYGIAGV